VGTEGVDWFVFGDSDFREDHTEGDPPGSSGPVEYVRLESDEPGPVDYLPVDPDATSGPVDYVRLSDEIFGFQKGIDKIVFVGEDLQCGEIRTGEFDPLSSTYTDSSDEMDSAVFEAYDQNGSATPIAVVAYDVRIEKSDIFIIPPDYDLLA